MLNKADRLGIEVEEIDDEIVPIDPDPVIAQAFKATVEEIDLVKRSCIHRGILTNVMNPCSMTMTRLMGTFDETSREWTDGVLSYRMRQASQDKSHNRQLIILDGPLEPEWVENLNSVLDDNRCLSIVTGERIVVTPLMTILLESADLSICSPATISRCAMIYMKDEYLLNKAHFNKWLKKLPDVLEH